MFKKVISTLVVVFLAFTLLTAGAVAQAQTAPANDNGYSDLAKQMKPPQFEISIPGLKFSEVAKNLDENGDVAVPFLGEFLAAVYKYAMVAGSVLAVILIIVEGFKIITSGGGEEQAHGYQNIFRIITGLIILWVSYFILYTLNPDLVNFKSLRVKYIPPQDIIDQTLAETQVNTVDDSSTTGTGSTPSKVDTGDGGTATAYQNCPFTLPGTKSKSDKAAFYDQIRTSKVVDATTDRQKIVQIANLAKVCQMQLGSCGRTAGTISALAVDNQNPCLQDIGGGCIDFKGSLKHGIPTSLRTAIYGLRCNFEGSDGKYKKYVRSDCVNTKQEATKKIKDILTEAASSGKLPGWPDKWADDLKPGDYVKVYNGNDDLVGSHSVIFIGWAGNGLMNVVQGNASQPTSGGTICVKTSCGDKMRPLLYIYAPN